MIRKYDKSDLSKINDLLKYFNYKVESNTLENKFLNILVYDDTEIKGVAIFNFIYDRIEIEYIIIKESYRNKGIASAFLKYIESNYNIKNITLEVRISNITAISFYKKNGFIEASIRKNYYKEEDGILMIKKLGE